MGCRKRTSSHDRLSGHGRLREAIDEEVRSRLMKCTAGTKRPVHLRFFGPNSVVASSSELDATDRQRDLSATSALECVQ